MGSGRIRAGFLAGLLLACPAMAAEDCRPKITERALAVAAVAGDVFRLDDGREVRLAAVVAPRPGLDGEPGSRPAEAARAALDRLVAGRRVGLSPVKRKQDRHGRLLAHVAADESDEALSLETKLLQEGHARVAAAFDRRQCLGPLLDAESKAREAVVGLWGDPYYAVRRADEAASMAGLAGSYLLAEGRIASVRVAGSQVYLNFARRWRDGLSVTIWKPYVTRFDDGEAGLRRLEGQRVRVRGWLSTDGRLLMAAGFPEQIERLAGGDPRRREQ